MSIAIGFGSTETNFEQAEFEAFRERAKERFRDLGLTCFTDEFREEMGVWLGERAAEYRRLDARYKDAPDHPDRYSQYWARIVGNGADLVAIYSFLHTNRRHAMSPDGWACLSTDGLAHVSATRLVRIPND